jgi:hypothetical protein
MANPAPWISDPTADDACARRGPSRGRGPQVHGGPVFKREGVRDPGHPREIERPRTRASDGRRRRRRRAAVRGGSSPALALDGAPGHLSDHRLVQNDAGTLAHVFVGSTGAIMPHRRPAPEGGGAAAPASLRVRCFARREEKLGGRYCSLCVEEVGGLTGREEAAAEGLDGGGLGGAPVSSGRGCHGRRGRRPAIA